MTEHRIISIENIEVNPHQPRKSFDEEKLMELAQSIRENGLIQPIVVREVEKNSYEIIAGERRFRAMQLIGNTEVPCLVTHASDKSSASLALIENIQRENLNTVEEAFAYRELLRTQNITQKELAQRIGKSQSAVANKIRLLDLSDKVLSNLASGKITERHARALVGVEKDKAEKILEKVMSEKLNVKQTETLINKPKRKRKARIKGISQNVRIGLNTVKQAVDMVEKTGIEVKHNVEETSDEIIVTIRFPK